MTTYTNSTACIRIHWIFREPYRYDGAHRRSSYLPIRVRYRQYCFSKLGKGAKGTYNTPCFKIDILMMDIFVQALVAAYCDLLDFYIKVRRLFTHKEGKLSCKWTRFWCRYQRLLLTSLDAQSFKRFFRVAWEPFEAQFRSIETRFIHHTNIVVRLAGAEHQIHFYNKETQERQRQDGECFSHHQCWLEKLTWNRWKTL